MTQPILFQRLEGSLIFVVGTGLYWYSGGSWWWFIPLLLLIDIACAGYLINPRVGALIYNLGHSLIGALGLLILVSVIEFDNASSIIICAGVWLAHVGVDRALGYGLKFPDSFQHTHLGMIGKTKQP